MYWTTHYKTDFVALSQTKAIRNVHMCRKIDQKINKILLETLFQRDTKNLVTGL